MSCSFISKNACVVIFLVLISLFSRTGIYIQSPMLLDAYTLFSTNQSISSNATDVESEGVSVIFVLIGQWGLIVITLGILFLCSLLINPSSIYNVQLLFSNYNLLIAGFLFGVYNVLITYARSGRNTPPYLHGILGSFVVPFQFISRYLILNKKPTILQLCCVIAILLGEFTCLLPTIIPGLETSSAHKDDGGATGIGAWLWPMCMVISLLPFAIGNVLIERAVHRQIMDKQGFLIPEINIIQYLFFWTSTVLITVLIFFWTDCIPGFGTTSSWGDYIKRLSSNFLCLFNLIDCPSAVRTLSWMNFCIKVVAVVAFPVLIRFTEGASFVVIVMTIRTPLVLLFWSLFDEKPFHWHPHVHLGTWLGIAAVCVIFPSVVLYNNGDNWFNILKRKQQLKDIGGTASNNTDENGLLNTDALDKNNLAC